MPTFKQKATEVAARQIDHNLQVVHHRKGELGARATDWLVGDEPGYVDVIKDDDFREAYEPTDGTWEDFDKLTSPGHVENDEGELVTDLRPTDHIAFPSDVEQPKLSDPERSNEVKE